LQKAAIHFIKTWGAHS